MKQGLLVLGLLFSFISFGQTTQLPVNESSELKTSSTSIQENGVTVEEISNEHKLGVKKIERPKVSEKKQIPTKNKQKK